VTCLLNCQSGQVTHRSLPVLASVTYLTKLIVFKLNINLLADQAEMTATFLPYIYFIELMLLVCKEAQVGNKSVGVLGGLSGHLRPQIKKY
jgi:hypothetical protein